jgi:LysM repeat protein
MKMEVLKMSMSKMTDETMDQVSGGSKIPYRVVAGDTLTTIAKRYNVTVEQLMKWNGIKDPNFVAVGQELKIKF